MKRIWSQLIAWLWWLLWILWNLAWPIFVVIAIGVLIAQALAGPLGGGPAEALGGMVGLLILALLVRNRLKLTVRDSVLIHRPPAEVFQFMATNYFQNRPRWYAAGPYGGHLVELDQTSPGPLGQGTTGRQVVTRGDRKDTWTLIVTVYEPDSRFALEFRTAGARTVTRYSFSPLSAGTDVAVFLETQYDGPARRWQWLWGPFLIESTRQSTRASTRRLRQLLEAAPAPDPATQTPAVQ